MSKKTSDDRGVTKRLKENPVKALGSFICDPYSYILLISFFETSFNYLRKGYVSVYMVLLIAGFLIQFYRLLKARELFGLVKSELAYRFILPMSLFIVLLAVSLIGAQSHKVGVHFIKNYIGSGMLVFLIATNIKSTDKIKRVLTLLSIMAVVNAVFGMLQVYVSSRFYLVPYLYPIKNAFYFNSAVLPNAFGLFMMNFNFGFTIMLGALNILSRFFNEKRTGWKIIFFLAWAVVLYGYLISFLRSSIIALLLGAIVIVVATVLINRGRGASPSLVKRLLAISLVTLIIVPSIFAQVHFFSKRDNIITNKYKERIIRSKVESDEARIVLYKLGLRIFLDHPLKGIGIGNYKTEKVKYLKDSDVSNIEVIGKLDSHNVFMEILCGAGILGLITYLYLMLFPVVRSVKVIFKEKVTDDARVIYILLLAYFCAALFDSNFHNFFFENMLWIGIGLFYSMELKGRERVGSTSESR
ncbi:MAG: O-antigen ligase family protein [Deltaproteobacteria bacterium]|uniref:O-antigen ligase family protein n=1 Tax=Candidatus Zymogenus saltonus TaxID=2844893 RepID=A0A9D8PQC5_9DELT|nr:O-antigen ligase family protein [Candidatus Zymogenus saltonus]